MPELHDLEVAEVSLVDKAANKRKFLLLKHSKGGYMSGEELILNVDDDKMAELLQKAAGNEDGLGDLLSTIAGSENVDILKELASNSDDTDIAEQLKKAGVSSKAMKAIRMAIRVLSAAKDEMPNDVMKTLAKLAGYQYPEEDMKKQGKGDGSNYQEDNMGKSKAKKSELFKEDGSLNLEGVEDEGTRDMLSALWKQNQDTMEEVKKANERADKMQEERDADRESLFKEREDRRLKDFVAKAEGFKNFSVDAGEFGALLKKCSDALEPKEFEMLEGVLKSADTGMASIFKETGTGSSGDGDNSAYAQLVKKAAEIASDEKISKEQAFVKAMDRNPELAQKEREERAH